jgi:hypothetical protein
MEMRLQYNPEDIHREDCPCCIWPEDLRLLRGPWQTPLHILFPNLVILDMEIDDIIMWLMPILNTMNASSPLHWLLIQNCDDTDLQALPFPSEAID